MTESVVPALMFAAGVMVGGLGVAARVNARTDKWVVNLIAERDRARQSARHWKFRAQGEEATERIDEEEK